MWLKPLEPFLRKSKFCVFELRVGTPNFGLSGRKNEKTSQDMAKKYLHEVQTLGSRDLITNIPARKLNIDFCTHYITFSKAMKKVKLFVKYHVMFRKVSTVVETSITKWIKAQPSIKTSLFVQNKNKKTFQ